MTGQPVTARPHPMMWHDIEGPDVLSPGAGPEDDGTCAIPGLETPQLLFDLPPAVARFARAQLAEGDPVARAEARDMLARALEGLRRCAAGGPPTVISLDRVGADALVLVDDALGEGEVAILISGTVEYQIQETLFPGLWSIRTQTALGEPIDRQLETGPVPSVVLAAATELTAERFVLPGPGSVAAGEGLMNALPLLVEIDARMQQAQPGTPNHVISLTNLPMSEADLKLLGRTIGGGEITARTRGYGATRVTSTRARHVWQVEYLNSMGQVILDTIELGGPPGSMLAAREDFEDSAERLVELLELA
jgi:hydrogenase-1 operon protein HyaF